MNSEEAREQFKLIRAEAAERYILARNMARWAIEAGVYSAAAEYLYQCRLELEGMKWITDCGSQISDCGIKKQGG